LKISVSDQYNKNYQDKINKDNLANMAEKGSLSIMDLHPIAGVVSPLFRMMVRSSAAAFEVNPETLEPIVDRAKRIIQGVVAKRQEEAADVTSEASPVV
jgi:hypothetical protein